MLADRTHAVARARHATALAVATLAAAGLAAVTDVARQLERSGESLPVHVMRIEGLVADASGDTLILNVGSKAGVKVGDRLQVTRAIRQVRDPATGKVIRSVEDKLGEVVITEVDESSSTGRYSGSPAKVGDTVKN